MNTALAALRYHVTGAIERGEAVAIVEKRAMNHSLAKTWSGTNPPDRFYIDGKRVSRERYDYVNTYARMYGRQDCFAGGTNRHGRHVATHCISA